MHAMLTSRPEAGRESRRDGSAHLKSEPRQAAHVKHSASEAEGFVAAWRRTIETQQQGSATASQHASGRNMNET